MLLKLAQGSTPLRALYRNPETLIKTKKLFSHYGKEPLFETINWVQGDILDVPSLEMAFAGVTQVYHCAALVSFDPNKEAQLRKVNIEGTANMVNCALAFEVQKFCHVSSIAALGDTLQQGETINEETEWNAEKNHSDYAISKYGAEMEVWRAWQEGLNVVIICPGLIFGYGFWQQGSGAVLRAVKRGQYFYTLGKCGIVAVEDVINCMAQLMENPVSGERYSIVAENLTYKELLDTIAGGLKKSKPGIYATPLMTTLAWKTDWLISRLSMRKRMLTKSMAQSSHATEVYDNTKIRVALNYSFIDVKAYLKELATQFLLSAKE